MTLVLNIGTQKAGTSTVYEVLKHHKQINVTKHKESNFFCVDEKYAHGKDYYLNEVFINENQGPLLEVDPQMIFDREAPRRIADMFGSEVKIFAILRDPCRRAYSQWNMETYRGRETRSFEQALAQEQEGGSDENTTYIARSLYSHQLANYYNYFDKKAIKLYIFERDFLQNREVFFKDLCTYMNVPWDEKLKLDTWSNPNRRLKSQFVDKYVRHRYIRKILRSLLGPTIAHRLDYRIQVRNAKLTGLPKLTAEARAHYTNKYFKSEIQKLQELIDVDLSLWLQES